MTEKDVILCKLFLKTQAIELLAQENKELQCQLASIQEKTEAGR